MTNLSKEFLQQLIDFRKLLHRNPEVSNAEKKTAISIVDFISAYRPDEVITNVGGYGVLAIFKGTEEGKCTAIRAELDGLPILEKNDTIDYSSENDGKSHTCGHDGHMVMVLSLLDYLSKERPRKGKVILLFQPAEETGEGAARMLKDEKFIKHFPDEVIGLHNIPGESLGEVLIGRQHFAAASKGIKLYFEGATSHAAEPENGVNPSFAISELVTFIKHVNQSDKKKDFAIATIIHIKVGEVAFGISPADGVIMLTLRSFENKNLALLEQQIIEKAKELSQKYMLKFSQQETEVFPATVNHKEQVDSLLSVVKNSAIPMRLIDEPFKWSEDFGHFLSQTKGVFFGLGSGENQPVLHHNSFDFPDDLIPIGHTLFKNYIQLNHY